MVISQMEIGRSTGNRSIGHDHSAFANYISGKYRRTGEYAYGGVSLTFLWPKQDVETKESHVHIAYQLMLQELYFHTHNTILVNKKEILQGIAVSLERQLALVREENSMEAVRLESFVQRLRETRDQENLLRIAHEIEDRLGIRGSFDPESGRENETWKNEAWEKEHVFNESADAAKNRAAGVSEMLRTINETQFQNMQQILMETYEKQQFSRSEEAEGSSIGVASELTHRQETVHSSVIDRYFAKLQSMVVSEVSQERETDAQQMIFEQQRDLLRKVYAESTEREKEEFAAYLAQTRLLHQIADKEVREYENDLSNEIIEQASNAIEGRLTREQTSNATETGWTREPAEQRTDDSAIGEKNETNTRLIQEMAAQVTKEQAEQRTSDEVSSPQNEINARLIQETTAQVTNELHCETAKEEIAQVTNELHREITDNITKKISEETTDRISDEVQNELAVTTAGEEINAIKTLPENVQMQSQRTGQSTRQMSDNAMQVTDSGLVAALMSKTAKVSEMLQTVNETQFQEMQQVLMESYEKQQLSRLAEAEESQIEIASGLTHRQKTAYSSIIDRYFARLQSMIMSEVSQIRETDEQKTIFEQQRDLLHKVYAESTEREKEEFAAYLGQTKLLHRIVDKAVKGYENDLSNKIIEQASNAIEASLTKEQAERRTNDSAISEKNETNTRLIEELATQVRESAEQRISDAVISPQNETNARLIREATAQATRELHRETAREATAQATSELRRETVREATAQATSELDREITDNITKKTTDKTTVRMSDEVQNELSVTNAGEEINAVKTLPESVQMHRQGTGQPTRQMPDNAMRVTDSGLAAAVMSKTAKVSEMLQTVDETQFQEMQQVLMESYEKQQLLRLAEAEESQLEIASGLTHRQKAAHSSVVDRYFARLQSMIMPEVSQIRETDEQKTIFEQQRDLLHKVYAESTEREKEEFAAYLEQTRLLHQIPDKAVREYENDLSNKIIEQASNAMETKLAKEQAEQRIDDRAIKEKNETNTRLIEEMAAQMTKELHGGLTKEAAQRVSGKTENEPAVKAANKESSKTENPASTGMTERAPDRAMRTTDSELKTAVINRTAKVFEMLQTVNETQFQAMQQGFMEVYEKQQLSRLMETQESGIGIVSGLTHRQKNRNTSIKNISVIERYFERLQSMIAVTADQTEKTDAQETIFEQQREILRKVYAESTEQEKEEFTSYLEENKLLYMNANKAVREFETKLHDEIADKVSNEVSNIVSNRLTREFEDRLTKEIANRRTEDKVSKEIISKEIISKAIVTNQTNAIRNRTTSALRNRLVKIAAAQAVNETEERTIGVVTGLTHVQKNRRSFAIDRYFERLQSMIVSDTQHRRNTRAQDEVSRLQQDLLRTVYTGIAKQEKEVLTQYFEQPRLLYKKAVKKAAQQQDETKIQEIVEHCVRRTTRVTESETVRRQVDDQKNEIAQLKEKVQRQHEQIDEFLRTGNRMPNMDRVYQEIEKRMESRLHLERLRRGM